ncbi:glycosyltransferase family 4 protein [Brevundimonas sp.]|jgi:glycosyltransferase involved in cell wall biosynthesis|uniref:glycosyltransferase family 4 protein n=1 Tax=Brevundimonas sp. TaxID=1871086 RepID=UPI0037C01375
MTDTILGGRDVRILLVIEPSGGGSGRHVIDLAQALINDGHSVSLIYSPTRAELRFEAEAAALPLRHLERLPMRRAVGPWDIAALLDLRRLIDRLGPFDIVHGHSAKAGALVRLAAPATAGRIYTPHALYTLHASGLGARLYGMIEMLLARSTSEAVIAVSDEEARHARRWRFPDARLHTIPNGLAVATPADRRAARRALALPPRARVVGFVGRLCPQKDPVRFARAVRLAHARNPHIVGVIIGEGALSGAARAAGGDAIRMIGACDARDLMAGFDLFAMTSRYEGFSYALIEAAMAGVPILATEVGGVSAVSDAGARVERLPVSATAEQLAQAMVETLERRRRPQIALGLQDRFSAARMAADTVAVYRRAFSRRRMASV